MPLVHAHIHLSSIVDKRTLVLSSLRGIVNLFLFFKLLLIEKPIMRETESPKPIFIINPSHFLFFFNFDNENALQFPFL